MSNFLKKNKFFLISMGAIPGAVLRWQIDDIFMVNIIGCFLLGFIREAQIKTWSLNRFVILKRKLQKINEHGKFNCIFSDGEYLFCYHTNSERAPTLRYVRREFSFNNIRYKDSDQEILLEDLKDESHKGYIISTKVLSEGEDWRDFEAGQLIVFKKGEIVFS